MSLAKNLMKLRKKLKMSQIKFAFEIDVSQQTICSYEQGRAMPSITTTCKILKLAKKHGLDINLEQLLCD